MARGRKLIARPLSDFGRSAKRLAVRSRTSLWRAKARDSLPDDPATFVERFEHSFYPGQVFGIAGPTPADVIREIGQLVEVGVKHIALTSMISVGSAASSMRSSRTSDSMRDRSSKASGACEGRRQGYELQAEGRSVLAGIGLRDRQSGRAGRQKRRFRDAPSGQAMNACSAPWIGIGSLWLSRG